MSSRISLWFHYRNFCFFWREFKKKSNLEIKRRTRKRQTYSDKELFSSLVAKVIEYLRSLIAELVEVSIIFVSNGHLKN